MQMPGYAPQPATSSAPTETAVDGFANISLPDPAETGLKPEPVKPPEAPKTETASTGEKSNATAAAIIQKHMQRRPGS